LSFPAVGALLAGGQLALHELLTAFSAPVPTGPPAPHSHGAALAGLPGFAPIAELAGPANPGLAPLMLATHAAATLGCALLIAKGDAALWTLAAWLRPLAGLPRPAAPVPAPRFRGLFVPLPRPRQPWRNLRQDSRRGPPSAVVPSR
ncbi:MAG: hypothetical protein HOQ06_05285, partial [Pseudarthrobacter sp.]|nr:hypothetical protein [Pseudarthrobacter sp.]